MFMSKKTNDFKLYCNQKIKEVPFSLVFLKSVLFRYMQSYLLNAIFIIKIYSPV